MSDRAPTGLKATGKRLWEALWGTYEFRPDEVSLVVELCRLADDIEAIRRLLKDAPLVVPGSKGQDTINPLRVELHRTSTRIEALVKTLGLPDPETGALGKSWAGRALARQRWSS